VEGGEGPELHQAVDRDKDQSYYLFELTQQQLGVARFPLGGKSKREVRELARGAGLVVAEKTESMEICFVAGGIRDFIEDQVAARPARFEANFLGDPAEVVDRQGEILSSAEPYYRYTVGQRRGLGVASGERLYVLAIEPERNRVVVGPEEDLLSSGLEGERTHWIGRVPEGPLEAVVRIRARHPGSSSGRLLDRRSGAALAERPGSSIMRAGLFPATTRVSSPLIELFSRKLARISLSRPRKTSSCSLVSSRHSAASRSPSAAIASERLWRMR
jgi:tRNA-specific 2-thiouridylase